MAEDGRRIAETVNHPFGLLEACYGVSMVYLRQGDVQRAIPVLEQAVGICQDADLPVYFPWVAAALGVAYALDGRVAAGLPRVEHGVEQAVAMGTPRFLALVVAWPSEAYLVARTRSSACGLSNRCSPGSLSIAISLHARHRFPVRACHRFSLTPHPAPSTLAPLSYACADRRLPLLMCHLTCRRGPLSARTGMAALCFRTEASRGP
jgi:hypothetical protein